ncbi:Aryl carrier domain-containing protein [Poseidonocella pacifica]|uniref:Aryl carrier domain-containing protein n=1 Tax=Poseidonocella pacifica TaxID=871651 RepID=A0A1I0WPI3_9RHOB|nr:phosphopantetheine-binding protein [Poseidonocella pacifica]SFA90679.1 Aryl carrier domain-containing protein [Poseidonocella pacifica]
MSNALTQDEMRADIADALGVTPEAIADDASLIDLGVDSMRMMDLMSAWEARQPGLDYMDFMESETLAAWWGIVSAGQKA